MRFGKLLGCHQKHERSFYVGKYQFFICARCTGLYLGNIIGIILIVLGLYFNLSLTIVLLIPFLFDGLLQALTSYKSNNFKRFISGLLFGIASVELIGIIFILLK